MEKHFTKYLAKHQVTVPTSPIRSDVKVVIPVFLEEQYLFKTLDNLCNAGAEFLGTIEIILVFNYSIEADHETISRQVKLAEQAELFADGLDNDKLCVTILRAYDVPAKYAGVGNARKVGMDYAVSVYGNDDKSGGVVISLDADTEVEKNYFNVVAEAFKNQNIDACTIYFEHALHGPYSTAVDEAIVEYELHLRYYLQALQYTGFPFACHTVGSCFAVTADAYVKAGGMPRKQAGEDFYFLQKVVPQSNFIHLSTTKVKPSSRPSDRVPFGTGPSIAKLLASEEEYSTYNLQAFIDLKALFDIKERFYKIDDTDVDDLIHELSGRMRSYLLNSDFFKALKAINDNCSSLPVFQKRFYEVFNAFRVVKYLNYVHLHFVEKMPVFEAAINLWEVLYNEEPDVLETTELLMLYRECEK